MPQGRPSSPTGACTCPYPHRGRRHSLRNGAGLQSLNDVHRMGFIEGLDHLDAKALFRAEKHRAVDGPCLSLSLPGGHGGPGCQHLGA